MIMDSTNNSSLNFFSKNSILSASCSAFALTKVKMKKKSIKIFHISYLIFQLVQFMAIIHNFIVLCYFLKMICYLCGPEKMKMSSFLKKRWT